MLLRTASATVVGPSVAMCDALATALVVAHGKGPALARSRGGYAAYIVRNDRSEDSTAGIELASLDESLPVTAAELVHSPPSLVWT
jgi:thiamine biosynthesis lipoprotein ApbE